MSRPLAHTTAERSRRQVAPNRPCMGLLWSRGKRRLHPLFLRTRRGMRSRAQPRSGAEGTVGRMPAVAAITAPAYAADSAQRPWLLLLGGRSLATIDRCPSWRSLVNATDHHRPEVEPCTDGRGRTRAATLYSAGPADPIP